MSGRVLVQVENLSKHYRLGSIGGATLREDLGRWWARVRGKPDPWARVDEVARDNDCDEGFWALRNVSFEVREGEVLGVIGRNGAGKSTLLKILSRITSPTSGRALIRGRVGSLLEVGTGFHPELTGRENVYLNGAILGMSRLEVSRKLDEIVEFSEMERFLDTPVKRYSSGMTVRLAFSVAAHLEPEIFIIDEVLAVGDVDFQKKCLGKMKHVANCGRTVLFVSHNMRSVRSLCDSAILLAGGSVHSCGKVEDVLKEYEGAAARAEWSAKSLAVNGGLKSKLFVTNLVARQFGEEAVSIEASEQAEIQIEWIAAMPIRSLELDLSLSRDGVQITTLFDTEDPQDAGAGNHVSVVAIPACSLLPGTYSVTIGAYSGIGQSLTIKDALIVQVIEKKPRRDPARIGLVNIKHHGSRAMLR